MSGFSTTVRNSIAILTTWYLLISTHHQLILLHNVACYEEKVIKFNHNSNGVCEEFTVHRRYTEGLDSEIKAQ